MLLLQVVIKLFQRCRSFCELFKTFFFFSEEVEFSEASVDSPGWRGEGSAAPSQRAGLDRDRPDQLQSSFNSFQLSVYSSALTHKNSWITYRLVRAKQSNMLHLKQRNDKQVDWLTFSVIAVGEGRGDQRALWERKLKVQFFTLKVQNLNSTLDNRKHQNITRKV